MDPTGEPVVIHPAGSSVGKHTFEVTCPKGHHRGIIEDEDVRCYTIEDEDSEDAPSEILFSSHA